MTSSVSVLFDALGPNGLRRSRIASVVAAAILVVVAAVIGGRLAAAGQLSEAKLGPLFNPGNENFAITWTFLGAGLYNTVIIALASVILSLVIGVMLVVFRISAARWYRWAIVSLLEGIRAVPVVLLIYAVSRVLPAIDTPLPLMWYLIIGIVLYNSAAISEIIRGGIAALPKGQFEAAASLGLSKLDTMRLIVLPQAFKMVLPALISQIAIAVKETSLGFVISFEELLRRGEIAIQSLNNPLQMFFVVGIIYIIINFSVSRGARFAEKRGVGKDRRIDTLTTTTERPAKEPHPVVN